MKPIDQWPGVRVVMRPLGTLTPYARNPRTHSPEQVAQLAASIVEWGWTSPVLIDEVGTIVAGHGRVLAAEKLGIEEVPCIVAVGWTDKQRRAYVIADNQLTLAGGWNRELLELETRELSELGFDVNLLGFPNADLSKLLTPEAEEAEPPPVPPVATTRPGDLWVCGRHRVLCGDSTKQEEVDRLVAGAKADLCFTSPPYGLGKSTVLSGNRKMSARKNPYDEYEDTSEAWARLMNSWFAASESAVSNVWIVNVQPLARNKRDLLRFMAHNAQRLVDVATWDKQVAAPAMSQGVMSSQFEWLIIFSSSKDASRSVPLSSWRGSVPNVYSALPQRHNEFSNIHAATMPLHLPVWVLQTLCDQAKSVYDPFLGTGTTLIAAEQLNRRCLGLEISPQYCDVTVKRWEIATGQSATLESDGKTFAETASARNTEGLLS